MTDASPYADGLATLPPGSPALSGAELTQVCDFIYARTGMLFGETKRYYVHRRVAERMARSGSGDVGGYLDRLKREPGEAEALINSFTINETYFYREQHQLECLSRSLLPELVRSRRPGDLLRLWSVPCATGEEAYSLALWLLDNWKLVDAYNVEIVGSDIDTRALAAAAYGEYGERALARLPRTAVDAYFEAPGPAGRRLIADLRESVSFTPVNLIDPASMADQGLFDVVLCRNVLIYFDDASRRIATDLLFDQINPGGFLCLGHTESMARISDRLIARRFPEALVYQRAQR